MSRKKDRERIGSFTRNEEIRVLAKRQWHADGQIEVDDAATVSEGEDNGAYVQAWVWVDFSGTKLDKDEADRRISIVREKRYHQT